MEQLRLSILLILLVAAPAAAAPLEFGSGARAEGTPLETTGNWVLLADMLGGEADIHFEVDAKDSWYRIERLVLSVPHEHVPIKNPMPETYSDPITFEQSTRISFNLADQNSSIFILADSVAVHTPDATGLVESRPITCPVNYMPRQLTGRFLFPTIYCPVNDEDISLESSREFPQRVSVSVHGARQLLVHDGGLFCSNNDARCPPSADRVNMVSEPAGADGRGILAYRYTVMNLSGVNFTFTADPAYSLAGGGAVNLVLDGFLRLPQASWRTCEGMNDCHVASNQTLRAWGPLELLGLRSVVGAGGRIAADIEGPAATLVFDEGPPVFIDSDLAAVLGITAILAAALKAALGAFSTRTKQVPLAHPNRRKLHDYILSNPGGTFREVVRGTGIPTGTARHHLAVLNQANLIQEHGHKSTLRYFENHGRFDESWNTVVMLREPELKRLHTWLLENPGSMQREVLDHADASWGWSRSTTQHRLKRLADEGLIAVKLQGRLKLYTANERAPVSA